MSKLDDKQGFMHLTVNDRSKGLCHMYLGDTLFEAHGLHFGLTQSPSKFQQCNRVPFALSVLLGFALSYILMIVVC